MKRLFCVLFCALLLTACAAGENVTESPTNTSSAVPSDTPSLEDSAEESAEESSDPRDGATAILTTQNYANSGKMGDTDGPAFAVYSEIGCGGASVRMDVAGMELNTVMPDGRFVNGYAFLGIDVYRDAWWINCIDAGLCWSGTSGGWHIFYNIYETVNESTPGWYESYVTLPKDDTYVMALTLISDERAKLTVTGERTGVTDSVVIEVKGAKADGSNTSFLFNTALDFPEDTKTDRHGNPCEDWVEITLANTDKGLYLRNFAVSELMLYRDGNPFPWTEEHTSAVSIWPDSACEGMDYSPTAVAQFDGTKYIIDLDMNR